MSVAVRRSPFFLLIWRLVSPVSNKRPSALLKVIVSSSDSCEELVTDSWEWDSDAECAGDSSDSAVSVASDVSFVSLSWLAVPSLLSLLLSLLLVILSLLSISLSFSNSFKVSVVSLFCAILSACATTSVYEKQGEDTNRKTRKLVKKRFTLSLLTEWKWVKYCAIHALCYP